MIISTQRATLLLLGASTVLANAADDSFTPDHQSRARSLNAGPTNFELRRRSRHHQDVSNMRLHQKRLIQGLIPGLGGSDSQTNDGSTQSSIDGNQEGSSPTTSFSPRPSSSPSSSGAWTKFMSRFVPRRVDVSEESMEFQRSRSLHKHQRRQLLSGVGDVVGGVADGVGGAVSGIGNGVGNALGGSSSGSDSTGSSQSSSSPSTGSSGGTSGDGGSGDKSSSSSAGRNASPSSSQSSSSANTITGSKNNGETSSSASNRQSATSAATSSSSSSNNNNNNSNSSNSSNNSNNDAASASSAAAAESQRQSSAAAAAAASSSQSAASAAQASSLSQSAASAASANAASAASASVNSAVSGTQAAASSTPSAVLITSSVPGGTTVITSIASLSPTGTADTYAGGSGNGRSGAADGSQSGSSGDGKLSTAAIVGIVVPVAVIALIILVWTVVRKRQQAKSRALHPLDFTPAYGSGDSPHQGVTRASQESWLGGGGRPMSGISDVEPDMMPPMEEMSHEDHLHRAGSYGGGYYNDQMALNVPPMAYSAATHGGAESRRLSAIQSADTHNDQYYDGSAAAGYHNPAVRGTDVAGLERSGTGGSTSPYRDVARGYDGASGGHGYGYDYRPDLDEPVRPQLGHGHEEAYGEDQDPFTYVPQQSAPAMAKSSSRWSG